ncbi:transient receptor potential cation channel subfamily M member 2 isoform X3 [Esox lucius]|uniref:transient receptor potential cation channel subfamily M member 2 isoform X3 n=1 Tax=Esox lucius TaxID=8010 RepID=UPI0014771334|nr:transient receptor potential cation channel subfamily M member 2 isoform X3 [Esox lucius]
MLPRCEIKIHPDKIDSRLGSVKVQIRTGLSQLFSDIKKHYLASWIKDNIQKEECCFYVQGDREGVCMCGYLKIHHVDDSIKPESNQAVTWDRHNHVRQVPTDAFGDISFGGLGQKTGKYVRVSSDTKPEVLYQLLTEHWKLPPPNLIISVTGGAKNFYMKPQLKAQFRRGLIKVAQTTGAWIITGGTHTGVMKHTGQAVRDYILSNNSTEGQIVTIGIATWGVIHNRKPLVHPQGRFPAYYSQDVQTQGHMSCLDNNHSHFLLVDDGTNGRYGVEIELRSRLERLISQQPLGNKESGVRIPVVCVVLEGGPGTLNTIYMAMLNGTPCVVLEGSGRLADVIAHVAGFPVAKVTLSLIHQLLKRFFCQEYASFTELMVIEWTKKIQDMIQMSQLLTVFRISEDDHGDVDVAILQALLKANRSSGSEGRESWERQLELAVAWNRVDIAKSDIFTEESQWKSSDLHEAMFSALLGNKHQFVRLFLENGVCLRQFLQEDTTLCHLYTHLPTSCFFLRLLVKRIQTERTAAPLNISLRLVSDEIRHLLGSFTQPLYPLPGLAISYLKEDVSVNLQSKVPLKQQFSSVPGLGPDRGGASHRDPVRDLFLWAILQNKKELAEIAWEQCLDCMSAALAASKILKKLAEEDEEEDDEAKEMRELANYYERHAIGVFSECHSCDEDRARRMLIRSSPSWGHTTCLRLALEANDKSFIAHSGVQTLLTQIWCGELAVDNPLWRVLLCMVFFPLTYIGFLRYRHDDCLQKELERSEEQITVESVTGCRARIRRKSPVRDPLTRTPPGLKPLNCSMRLVSLFTSPQVKFYWNIVFYFGFLLLFSVVLMIDFQTTPSWRECLLYVWIFSLVCEEIRQLFHDPDGFPFNKKAKMYIKDMWNILDVLSILLFIIGLVFSKTLGPKIIIVKRMILDMFFFLFLLSIWVLAFGVAKQGILINNEDRLNWIVRGAVYEPYLIIFGNMPSDIDTTQFDISACTVNGTDPLKPKCPVLNEDQRPAFPEWLTIILLCVYLLFANILLLNLLIAIFNYTFQEVQDNTDNIWKFQRYELIKEYYSRPALPPPFILLSHIYIFIRRLVLRKPLQGHQTFKEELSKEEEEELLSWESFMKDNYLQSTRQQHSQDMDQRLSETADKVDIMTEMLQRENNLNGTVAMGKRITRLEDQVSQSAEALQWIMDALKSQGFNAIIDAPQLASPGKHCKDESADPKTKEVEKKSYHVNARRLVYPGSNITRFPVPEEKVPWEVEFSLYSPPVLNEDGQVQSDRNPQGRTGMRGRGSLCCLGPNHILELVLTRWRDTEGSVLEFLSVWNREESLWELPGGLVQSDEPLSDRLQSIFGQRIYNRIKAKVVEGSKVYEGYVDDIRNTDSAWLETTVLNIHLDRTDHQLADINRMTVSSLGCDEVVQWLEVNTSTRMSSYQKDSLRRVAELHLWNM